MRYLSVCSGIEAATVAWHPLGWEAVAYSEIEKFPCAVLAHHYPSVPNRGDMNRFKEWPDANIDVLVGGTPCQSFSVAGLRAGLADPRGNLALVFLAIADRYRPCWLLWENVPGVLSSGGGRDFGSFIGALAKLGYGFTYRVLDAQYFGVPQRRRRVFVVGHLGDWRRAAAVLFERESMSGHPAPSRETRERLAPTIAARTNNSNPGCETFAIQDEATRGNPQSGPGGKGWRDDGAAFTHQADHVQAVCTNAVRRLTPKECARLQGFPDDYLSQVPGVSDSAQYRALGNSMAVPVMRWLGERIALVEASA